MSNKTTMRRDEVIRLLKTRAQGADFTEELLRAVCRNAAAMLHRERAAESVTQSM